MLPDPLLPKAAATQAQLPDFIGIGAQKAGTTWAYHQLKTHPQVFVTEIKELNYFISEDKSAEWYQAQFAPAQSGQKKGEVSPNYTAKADTAERMYALVPQAKLFYILRNPTQRAFSQWKMARKLGNVPRDLPFIEVFRKNLQFIQDRGRYLDYVRRFERLYNRPQQLRIFFYDDLCADPRAFLRDLFQFIGVDDAWEPPQLDVPVGKSTETTEMSPEDELEVRTYYQPYVEELKRELGAPVCDWNVPSI